MAAFEDAGQRPDTALAVQVFQAMTHWQLGNHDKARQIYDRAAAAIVSLSQYDDDISCLLREAQMLMGLPADAHRETPAP